jgi:signal transduction histidine kinase
VFRAQRTIEWIIRDGHTAIQIVRRVRALFSQTTPTKSPIPINEVVDEVSRLLQSEITLRAIALELDMGLNLPLVSADRVQIQQVLVNLVRNAEDAMECANGLPKVIVIRSRCIDANIVVEIADHGHGVQDNERIFEPFYTTKENGMGVGLGISRSIIQAHEGKLWARPNEPRGTIFSFTLPTVLGVDNVAASPNGFYSG